MVPAMARDRVPRLRLAAIPDEALLVVRGDELLTEMLRRDARRFRRRFDEWGRFGVSGFLAASDPEVDALCETRLVLFEKVVVFVRRDLTAAGIEVVPTFRRPHVTLAHVGLNDLVAGLQSCEHRQLENPYFEGTL
jgi:hypothetical protein